MTVEEERLQREIDELLAKAQAADEADDEHYGRDCRGGRISGVFERLS